MGMAAVVAGCTEPETDPRTLAKLRPAQDSAAEQQGIEPAVGTIVGPLSMPARPMGETRTRARLEAADEAELVIAVGQLVDDAVDDELRRDLSRNLDRAHTAWRAGPDRDVVEMLMVGSAELGLIGGELSARELHAGLRQTPIAVELFALAVPSRSPLRSLTSAQVRQVLTGQVRQWSQLGYDGGDITVVVPADRSLAERAARTLMPGDAFAANCVRVADERGVADQLLRDPAAIAVVRVGAGARPAETRLLQIDWAQPTQEAFAFGSYPFGIRLQLIGNGPPDARAQQVLTFLRTPAGQQLLGRSRLLLP